MQLYLRKNGSGDINCSIFDVQNNPCSIKLSKWFYFELISQLEMKLITWNMMLLKEIVAVLILATVRLIFGL